MNNIQNYDSVNVNANYGKVNRSPNFKALKISDKAIKYLVKSGTSEKEIRALGGLKLEQNYNPINLFIDVNEKNKLYGTISGIGIKPETHYEGFLHRIFSSHANFIAYLCDLANAAHRYASKQINLEQAAGYYMK